VRKWQGVENVVRQWPKFASVAEDSSNTVLFRNIFPLQKGKNYKTAKQNSD
jgi:hypothetical protein